MVSRPRSGRVEPPPVSRLPNSTPGTGSGAREAERISSPTRRAGKGAPEAILENLPAIVGAPKAILWDKEAQARRRAPLLYVFDVPGEARLGKLVMRIDYVGRRRNPAAAG